MNIGGLQISFGTEIQDLVSLNIYLSGCKNNKQCLRSQCHNPDLKDFEYGSSFREAFPEIEYFLQNNLIDAVCLLGGEPLDNSLENLKELILFIKSRNKIPVYMYSGYEDEIFLKDSLQQLDIDGIFFGAYSPVANKKFMK